MRFYLPFFLIFSFPLFSSFKEELKGALARNPPSWMLEQIEKDLAYFKENGISSSDLDGVCKVRSNDQFLVRLKIKNHHLSIEFPSISPVSDSAKKELHLRSLSIFKALKRLTHLKALPDLDFVIHIGDYVDEDNIGPIFTFAKKKFLKKVIVFPDFEALLGYSKLSKEVIRTSSLFPFEKKIDKAFWRGATTGGTYKSFNWKTFPRSIATLLSLKNPDLLDAKFTSLVQTEGEIVKPLMKDAGVVGNPTPVADHLKYRYLLDIDGNSCTYSRLYWILLSNSTCIKQVSNNTQWYYQGLKPFVHYLPVQADLSDLIEVLSWAKKHPQECKKIAENATLFAKESLSAIAVHQYIYLLLNAYAKLLKE